MRPGSGDDHRSQGACLVTWLDCLSEREIAETVGVDHSTWWFRLLRVRCQILDTCQNRLGRTETAGQGKGAPIRKPARAT
jgi:hypothetical protein